MVEKQCLEYGSVKEGGRAEVEIQAGGVQVL